MKRQECAADGRGAFITLTTDGADAIREAAPQHVAAVRRLVFDRLSERSARRLRAGLLGHPRCAGRGGLTRPNADTAGDGQGSYHGGRGIAALTLYVRARLCPVVALP